jgi:hypothetical protein
VISELLTILLDGHNTPFVVLRNGEGLPHIVSGTDIDISTRPTTTLSEIVEYLREHGHANGWIPISVSQRPHTVGLALLRTTAPESPVAMHIDIFAGITVFGITLLSAGRLANETETRNNVVQLTNRGRQLATLVHHVAWNGGLSKEKYRDELLQFVTEPSNCSWLDRELVGIFGRAIARECSAPLSIGGLGKQMSWRRMRAVFAIFVLKGSSEPVATATQFIRYVLGHMRSILSPSGLIGHLGDRVPEDRRISLSLQLACQVCPHAFGAKDVRSSVDGLATLNGPRYEAHIRKVWHRWSLIRWFAPSIFLWVQAKRNRWVVVSRMPLLLRCLQRSRYRPHWIALPQ